MSLEGCKLRFWQVFDCFWTDVPGSKAVGPARSGPVAAKGPGADWHYITGSLGQLRVKMTILSVEENAQRYAAAK